MTPSLPTERCPFCLARRRIRADGCFSLHDWGRSGMKTRCPGSAKTLEQARADKRAGNTELAVPSGRPDTVRDVNPEDIF